MPLNHSVFLTEMLWGWEDIALSPVWFLSSHPVPGKADSGVTNHTYFMGFQPDKYLSLATERKSGYFLKLTTGAEPDTIQYKDQLREIKMLTTGWLSCTRVTAAIHAIHYPTQVKTYGLVTTAQPAQSKFFPHKRGRASPTKYQLGQFLSYQEQALPAAFFLLLRRAACTNRLSHIATSSPKTCHYSESDDAQRKVQTFNLTTLSTPKINVGHKVQWILVVFIERMTCGYLQ